MWPSTIFGEVTRLSEQPMHYILALVTLLLNKDKTYISTKSESILPSITNNSIIIITNALVT